MTSTSAKSIELECDYLVVGAGTACLSFVDSLLTHHSNATVILIDRNAIPGGHWTTAYPFVRLHQPACFYGVNSMPLGKNRTSSGDEVFDISDRSSSQEICLYYQKVVETFEATGRVQAFFNTEYTKESDESNKTIQHILRTPDGVYTVKCQKIVCCETKVVVPSMRDVPFPVDPSITIKPVNYIPEAVESGNYSKYMVIGAGKTGTDAIVQLLRSGIDQKQITWIISRDVWYAMRDGMWGSDGKRFYKRRAEMLDILLEADSLRDAVLGLEREGKFAKLDPNGPYPAVFKGPTIDSSELELARSVKNRVRMGRVTSITSEKVLLDKGSISISGTDTLVVDCMAENLYGYADFEMGFKFFNKDHIRLGPVTHTFNPSLTSALVGYLEGTFLDDEVKNGFLYFPCGIEMHSVRPESFLLSVVSQMYTMSALSNYRPAMKFLLQARTFQESPKHHGGMVNFLWGAFGPVKLVKKQDLLMEKIKSGGYSDLNNIFEEWPNAISLDSKTIKAALRTNQPKYTKKKKAFPTVADQSSNSETRAALKVN